MRLSSIGTRAVVTVAPSANVLDVARLMEQREVGCVIVTAAAKPVGILTDRDLVLRVLDRDLDPSKVTAAQVMTTPVVCIGDAEGAIAVAARMREHRVRRLPVVDGSDHVIALVTFDDLLRLLGRTHREMADLIESFPVSHQGG
jgi:CBS domain-containing protein